MLSKKIAEDSNNKVDEVSDSHRCYLGLGGNIANELGTPDQLIRQAISRLAAYPKIDNVRLSSLYVSKPMGPQDQPNFINAVAELETTLTPNELLTVCHQLEMAAQRVRLRRWGERSLDVDILLFGEISITSPSLTIPHMGILERNFVLVPLAELNPELIIKGTKISQVAMSQNWEGLSIFS